MAAACSAISRNGSSIVVRGGFNTEEIPTFSPNSCDEVVFLPFSDIR